MEPEEDLSDVLMDSSKDNAFPSGPSVLTVQSAVASYDFAGFISWRIPFTHVSTIFVSESNNSPSVTTKFASFPRSTVPTKLDTPSNSAGVVVSAFNAALGESPRSTAILTFFKKSAGSDSPLEQNAKVIPAADTLAGFSGAMSHSINVSNETFNVDSKLVTFGADGKFTGSRIERPVAAIASSRRNSNPFP